MKVKVRLFKDGPSALRGALLTFASAACISVTFIASKQAMQELSPLAFTPLWFAAASGWGAGFYLMRNGAIFPERLGARVKPLLLLGFLNGVANLLLFVAINLGDPTLVAFFSRSETIYSVFLGAHILSERMLPYQWLGVGIALAGAAVMTFKAGAVVWLMLLLTLVSNLFLSLSTLVAKKYIHTVSPLLLSTARTMVMMLLLGAIGLATQQLAWPSFSTGLWIIGGAFFGPFLSYVLLYKGLLYLDLAKAVVIRSTQPLFVAVYSLALFGTLITFQQLLGGLLMIAGIMLMLWQRSYQKERISPPVKSN